MAPFDPLDPLLRSICTLVINTIHSEEILRIDTIIEVYYKFILISGQKPCSQLNTTIVYRPNFIRCVTVHPEEGDTLKQTVSPAAGFRLVAPLGNEFGKYLGFNKDGLLQRAPGLNLEAGPVRRGGVTRGPTMPHLYYKNNQNISRGFYEDMASWLGGWLHFATNYST